MEFLQSSSVYTLCTRVKWLIALIFPNIIQHFTTKYFLLSLWGMLKGLYINIKYQRNSVSCLHCWQRMHQPLPPARASPPSCDLEQQLHGVQYPLPASQKAENKLVTLVLGSHPTESTPPQCVCSDMVKNLHLLMQQLSLNKAWSIKNDWVERKMTGEGKELLQPESEKCSWDAGDLIYQNQMTHDAAWRQPSSTSSKWIQHLRVEQVFPQPSLSFFPPRLDFLVCRWSCITLLRYTQVSTGSEMVGMLFTGFLRKNWFWIRARKQSGSSTNTLPCPCPGAARWRQPWSDLGAGNRASNGSSETGHVCIMPSCPPGLAFCLHKIRFPQD